MDGWFDWAMAFLEREARNGITLGSKLFCF